MAYIFDHHPDFSDGFCDSHGAPAYSRASSPNMTFIR
jgi:hypothetical protein